MSIYRQAPRLPAASLRLRTSIFSRAMLNVDNGILTVSSFPLVWKRTQLAVEDIQGIQVNEERDSDHNLTHYSLVVVGRHFRPLRILHRIPEFSQAQQLARQIDALIAPHRR
jgi:hypothetical protein